LTFSTPVLLVVLLARLLEVHFPSRGAPLPPLAVELAEGLGREPLTFRAPSLKTVGQKAYDARPPVSVQDFADALPGIAGEKRSPLIFQELTQEGI